MSSIDLLTQYYDMFKQKKEAGEHDLKIATIFSYQANEDDKNAQGDTTTKGTSADGSKELKYKHSRDSLEGYIQDYNLMYGTKYSTKDSQSYYNYYNNIAKRVKNREIDILLVVNMFLTGFDSKPLNTLYVDKNLRYHGLIQAFSRTNRILDEKKSQGNIVAFRNLKKNTDDAITLFSNKDAKEIILVQPYEEFIKQFNEQVKTLKALTPTIQSVDDLINEEQDFEFIKAFRDLMRTKNILVTFADFSENDLYLMEQEFEDYKSKYLDLYDKYKVDSNATKDSIVDDVNFEIELIHRDDITVTYILNLLQALKSDLTLDGQADKRKHILSILAGDKELRSKRELIEQFIDEHLKDLKDSDNIPNAFDEFWNTEKEKSFIVLCEEEDIDPEKMNKVLNDHLYSNQIINRDDIIETLKRPPKLLDRKPIASRVLDKIYSYVDTFIRGMVN